MKFRFALYLSWFLLVVAGSAAAQSAGYRVLFSLLIWYGRTLRITRTSLLTATAALAIVALSVTLGGCGGYGSTMQRNRGTAAIMVTAQSGNVSHTATVSVAVG